MDSIIEKFEIATVDEFIKHLSYNSFLAILLNKVKNSFISSFNDTNVEYNFEIETKADPLGLENLKTREFILSQKTVENLRGNLRYELLAGLSNNESIDQIKKRLDKIFVTNSVNTERIARSEIVDAQNAGRISAYKASEVVTYKMWKAAAGRRSKRVCDLCKRLNGQIQPLDEPFVDPKNPGETWQHPIAHPNGGCTTIPLRKLPDNIIYLGGQMYAGDYVVGKLEIPTDLLKNEKHYETITVHPKKGQPFKRRQLVGRKEEIKSPEKSTSMTLENVEKVLTLSEFGVEGGLHDEESYVVKFKDGSTGLYKTMDEGFIIGETSTYDLSKILNWDIIPETIQVDFGKGDGSCQKWVEDSEEPCGGDFETLDCIDIKENHLDDLSKIFIIDMIIGNRDRHSGNVMISGNNCRGIDNEGWGNAYTATEYLQSLDWHIGFDDEKSYSPMLRWLNNNINKESLLIFREKIIMDMKSVIENKDKIINYYNKYENDDLVVGEYADAKSIALILLRIKDNLDYIEKYYRDNK